MDTKLALKEYGLTEKEISVYLALLPLGSINIQEICKRVDLPRTTIYNTVNYLSNKGLVSFIIKKGTRYYQAADPEKIIDNLNQKREILKEVLPQLKGLQDTVNKSSSVEMYQGSKGLFTILSDIFNKKQEVLYFGSYSLSKEVLKHQPEHFRNIRLERKIRARIVMDYYDEPTFHTKEYTKITKMRFNDSLKNFPCMIFVYGDKVAIYTLKKDLIGIIISNEQLSQAMRLVFEIYWDNSKARE